MYKLIQAQFIHRKVVQDGLFRYKHTNSCSPAFRCQDHHHRRPSPTRASAGTDRLELVEEVLPEKSLASARSPIGTRSSPS